MRKIVLSLILTFVIISCTPEGEEFNVEVLPVAKVEMQTVFALDSVTNIPVTYLRPSNCHFFEDFYYLRNDFTRVIAVYNSTAIKENCETLENDSIHVNLRFKPSEIGTYTLKFWKGVGTNGQDEFFEYQAVVNH